MNTFNTVFASIWITLSCAAALLAAPASSNAQSLHPHTVTFRPTDPLEVQYIYRELGSQEIPDEHSRFQDKTSFIIYRFAFVPGTAASLSMRIVNQFQVDLSRDGKQFDTVAVYTKQRGDPLRLDLTPYTSGDGFVYVRIGDAKPDDGWGGKIYQMSITGMLRDVPTAKTHDVTPIFVANRTNLYPKLAAPERHLFHFNPIGANPAEMILFRTLQGLVNRDDKNELMVADTWRMIPELQRRGWIDGSTDIPDADALFRQFPKRDCVVYDPELYGSENLAVMIGEMEGLVVAHPRLVERYHLNIKQDLRGRWKTTLEGYREVYAKYKSRFNPDVLVMCAPSKRPDLYDYAVAHHAFTFWIVGGTDANRNGADRWGEEEWFEAILSRDFAVNIPILGYPQVEPEEGIGENRGVALFSRCGKFLIPADHMANMSLLSSYPNARDIIKIPTPAHLKLDRSKVYASMVLSDGDNQCLWNGPTAFMFRYMNRMKAEGPRPFAVSYTMGPSIVDLNPLAASIVNENLEPQDSIGGAVSGVGYMYMRYYANNFGKDRYRVVKEYTDLTSRYLGYAGEHWDWIMDYGGPGSSRLKDYAALKGCVALMGGYGRETTDPAKTSEVVVGSGQEGSIVAFHSVSRMVEPKDVLADVHLVLDKGVKPLFLHIFISNWGVNPRQYRQLALELQQAGVEIVTPETLADLFWQYERRTTRN